MAIGWAVLGYLFVVVFCCCLFGFFVLKTKNSWINVNSCRPVSTHCARSGLRGVARVEWFPKGSWNICEFDLNSAHLFSFKTAEPARLVVRNSGPGDTPRAVWFAVILNSRVRKTGSVHVPGVGGSTGGTPGVTYLQIPSGEDSALDPSSPRQGRAGCRSGFRRPSSGEEDT